MKIEIWPIDRPRDYPRNARKWSAQAVDKLAASIRTYGWRQPVVVDTQDTIIIGHLRRAAGRKAGMAECPVHVATDLTAEQVRGLRIADNRLAQEAEFDFDLLNPELLDLRDLGFDLTMTAFDLDEIDRLIGPAIGLTEPDVALEVPIAPVTIPGDVWLLGAHRLLCGDATEMAVLNKVMDGAQARMVFTDPPYNVSYVGKTAQKLTIQNDALEGGFYDFLRAACTNMLAVTTGVLYVCMSSSELHTLHHAFTDAGGHWSTFLIWAKNHFTLGRSDYQRMYEPILYGWREGATHFWCGDRDQGDVWSIKRPVSSQQHPTMKPVELVERAIRNSSVAGDIVLDPFAGSGTTLIACERTGRLARVIELDPAYGDVIVIRWQEYTGKDAIHEETGATFEHLKCGRRVGAQDEFREQMLEAKEHGYQRPGTEA